MKYYSLGSLCEINKGKQIDTSLLASKNKYKYINGGINESGYYNDFNTDGETILISEGGASCGHVNYINEKFWCGCHCYKLTNCKFDVKYMYYVLKANQDKIMALRTGAAMPNINKQKISSLEIKLVNNKVEQNKIVTVLDKVINLINAHNKQLQKLEELVKSQFVEMFGNVESKKKLNDLTEFLSRGKSPNYSGKSKIKVINQACVYWNKIKYENIKYQDENKFAKSSDKILKKGDILINSTGTGTLGRCNIFYNEGTFIADGHITIVRFNRSINPEYFKYYFMQGIIQKRLYSECVTGSTNQIELSKEKFKNFKITVPPIELQNQFADFVKQVDKQKFEIENSLKEMQKLYESLMQKYFG